MRAPHRYAQVAESVLVTPRTAAGGSWKNIATSTQETAAGAAEAVAVPPWKGSQAGHSQQRQVRFVRRLLHVMYSTNRAARCARDFVFLFAFFVGRGIVFLAAALLRNVPAPVCSRSLRVCLLFWAELGKNPR